MFYVYIDHKSFADNDGPRVWWLLWTLRQWLARFRNSRKRGNLNIMCSIDMMSMVLKVKSMQRSQAKFRPQNQNGKYLILQIVKLQKSSYGQLSEQL